jgi:hypothetical protein
MRMHHLLPLLLLWREEWELFFGAGVQQKVVLFPKIGRSTFYFFILDIRSSDSVQRTKNVAFSFELTSTTICVKYIS